MHIQGHSAAGGRHGTGRQQDRMRETAKEQQGRHVLPVNSNPEVQAEFDAVTGLQRSNRLPARHSFAYGQV
jgi:hypothetical protein